MKDSGRRGRGTAEHGEKEGVGITLKLILLLCATVPNKKRYRANRMDLKRRKINWFHNLGNGWDPEKS